MVLFLSLLAFYSEIQGWVLGTLIFSYIRRLGPLFGFKLLNFNILGFFQKNEYFWGYDENADIFWGYHLRSRDDTVDAAYKSAYQEKIEYTLGSVIPLPKNFLAHFARFCSNDISGFL